MHRKNILLGQNIVQNRKNALFHLTRIFRPQNNHLSHFKTHIHARRRGHLCRISVRGKSARIKNDIIRLAKIFELCARGAHKHIVHKQSMVSPGANNAHLNAIFGIPTRITVNHIDAVANIEIIDSPLSIDEKRALVELDIDLTPPDIVRTIGMIHNALVLWTAPGLFSRTHNKCPSTRNSRSGLVGQCLFVKHRWRSIPQNKRPGDIIAFQIYSGHKLTPLNCQFSIPTPQYITQNISNQILLRAQKFLHFSQIVIIFCT